ncbi:MAG: sulfotransferase [Microcoleus sp. SIO2G3]|nr:sulfotransferase [Microcoleus sp. SIO2G3]
MFRSASTLQFQITTQLVQESGTGIQVGWIDAKRFAEVRSRYADESGYKVIKIHICPEPIQAEFRSGNAIGIYIHRDIRDVYASMMKQRQKSFDFLWSEGFLDTCLESYQTWTQLPNVLVSQYADVMADLPREVDRIAQHLKIPISRDRARSIAAAHDLNANQQRIAQFRQQLLTTPLDPSDHREIVDYHEEATLLHMNHIDPAKVDRWKED